MKGTRPVIIHRVGGLHPPKGAMPLITLFCRRHNRNTFFHCCSWIVHQVLETDVFFFTRRGESEGEGNEKPKVHDGRRDVFEESVSEM